MYILELISKWLKKEKEELNPKPKETKISFEPEIEDIEKCEHIFLPIDSTKKILACTKCGFILKVKDQPKKNFFIE